MKKSLLATACLVALLCGGLPALAQTDPAEVGVTTAPPWNQTGQDFVQFMMMSDKFEIESSRLALERSRDPAIRNFAKDMIGAHTESSADLKEVSDHILVGQNVTPPPVLDPQHLEMYAALEASFGRDFDGVYLDQQLDAHRQALAYVQGYARHGGVWQLERFARETEPVIRDHLAMLRSIRGDVAMNVPPDTAVITEPPAGPTTTVIETH